MSHVEDLREKACVHMKTALAAVAEANTMLREFLDSMTDDEAERVRGVDLSRILFATILPAIPDMIFAAHACNGLQVIADFRNETEDVNEFVDMCKDHASVINARRERALIEVDESAPCSREMEGALVRYATHVQLSVVQAALSDVRNGLRELN
jgi:hypothetical protein